MTENEKAKVRFFRTAEGFSYGEIADRLGLSENTVKSFCRRNGLTGVASKQAATVCRQCHRPLVQESKEESKRKGAKFCSEACRRAWWKEHPELVVRRAYYTRICAHCGKTFQSYGNNHRKYCGHPCYIAARFGGGDTPENGGVEHGERD